MPELTREEFLRTLALQQGLPPELFGGASAGATHGNVGPLKTRAQATPPGLVPLVPKYVHLKGIPGPQGVMPRGLPRYFGVGGERVRQVVDISESGTRVEDATSKIDATLSVTGEPTWGDCGEFEWVVEWKLKDAKGGFVVQFCKFEIDVVQCPYTSPDTNHPIPPAVTWAEAFKMNEDGSVFGAGLSMAQDGHFYNGPVGGKRMVASGRDRLKWGPYPNTKGWWSLDLQVVWIPGNPPDAFFESRKESPYGDLPAIKVSQETEWTKTKIQEALGEKDAAILLHRHIFTEWDCCSKVHEVKGEASSTNFVDDLERAWVKGSTGTTFKPDPFKPLAPPKPAVSPTNKPSTPPTRKEEEEALTKQIEDEYLRQLVEKRKRQGGK